MEEQQFRMENNNFFDCIIIKKGDIKHLDWEEPNYISKLMNLNLFDIIKTNSDNFVEFITVNLDINKYKVKNLTVKTEIISDEPNYVYELMYVDLINEKEFNTEENLNEMASLVNTNGEKIYSNAIFIKNYTPTLSDSMYLCDVSKKDLEYILSSRVYTNIVIYDEKWREEHIKGDLSLFANQFFDDEYKKIEIPFLMHNINIWYMEGYEYERPCGNIIDKNIEKCIWFTMKTNDFRGNLTLDEVKKIVYLSEKLKEYKTPSHFYEEKIDKLGRKIIYNKYKVLDNMYNKNI
jgi:hypothetical protein